LFIEGEMASLSLANAQGVPLLKTKLYIPPARPDLVSRPRLIERLEEGLRLGHKLTLISAPAGFGKTTLLSEWVADCELCARVAWLSLDEGDNDVARFWSYAISALQTLEPAIGQTALGALQASQAQPLPLMPLLISLVNDVTTYLSGGRPYVLILDDYHVLEMEAIHESLDDLLDHLPPVLRLVVASREDPPLGLSLLRGRGQLNEIRAADLRFTPAETAEFLSAVMGLGLSANDIAALENRTEGWVVGLQMAALSLRGQTDPEAHGFVSAFTGDDRYVADYLLDQILHRQTPDIQRFLMQTSILDRLCGPLCDAVLASQGTSPGSPFLNSQEVLEYLERAGLFLLPLDNRRHWYRYHHLFADLLRSRLQAVPEPLAAAEGEKGEIAGLHLRASAWYEGEGLIAEAMDHALAATDYVRAADLIERHYKETVWLGEFALVRKWVEALPKALVRSRPFLCLMMGVLSLDGSVERAEEWLQAAEEAWEAQPQPVDRSVSPPSTFDREVLVANVLDIRATLADVRGASSEEVIALTLRALEVTPESAPSLRASMCQRLGWCYLNLGDEVAAERFFLQSQKLGEAAGHHGNTISVTVGRAVIAWGHGRLHKAVAICRETLQSVVEPLERSGRRLPAAGNLYIILGRILLEFYELGEAEPMLAKGVELAELTLRSGDLLDGYHALACLRCIERDFEGALAWMEKAERTCTWAREGVYALRARIWLWWARVEMDRHYLDLALAWARGRDLEHPADNDWELQSLAQAYIAGYRAYGEPDLLPLLGILGEQLRRAEARDRPDQMIYMLVLEVLARQAMGQMDPAMNLLERALALAAPHRFGLTFLLHGAPMEVLLREAAARGISAAYVGWLLSALAGEAGDRETKTGPRVHRPPRQPLLEPLSEREMDVLRLLNSALSSSEIADELYVSVNTVRTHIRNIYAKLDVHRRSDAVSRAGELGLL
jgi:LuxR family maltose regulon positive regulatory protein